MNQYLFISLQLTVFRDSLGGNSEQILLEKLSSAHSHIYFGSYFPFPLIIVRSIRVHLRSFTHCPSAHLSSERGTPNPTSHHITVPHLKTVCFVCDFHATRYIVIGLISLLVHQQNEWLLVCLKTLYSPWTRATPHHQLPHQATLLRTDPN